MGLIWAIVSALVKTIFSKDDPIVDDRQRQPTFRQSTFRQPEPCVSADAYREWYLSQAVRAEPTPRPPITPARQQEIDRYWADQRARGETTLCCNWSECFCGQNVRLVNGRPMRCFGTTLPGSDYDKFKKSTGGGYSLRNRAQHQAERAAMNATTQPLPRIDP
jgi:hypothetical protein